MSIKKAFKEKPNIFAVVVAALLILSPIGYSVLNSVFARGAESAQPFLERPDEKYENCVRETEYMRFHHWELLREIRDETVRDRIRGEVRVASCRECHPNRDRFCNRCHDAVNLKPDCWGCHYYPDSPQVDSGEEH